MSGQFVTDYLGLFITQSASYNLIRVICDEMSALLWLAFFLALFGFVFLRMIFPL